MDEYSNSATRQLLNLGNRFGRWAGACAGALADDLAGSAGDASANRTMILMAGDRTEVYCRGAAGPREIVVRFGGSRREVVSGVKLQPRKIFRKGVLLRIGSDKAVVKRIGLPAGAVDVLPAVVRNKVESLAPWPVHEVLWGYRVAGPPQSGQIAVDVGIVSRKTVDGLLAALQDANIKVNHLDIGQSPAEAEGIVIDFLGSGRTGKARGKIAAVMSVAGLIAAGVTGYGLYLAASAYAELSTIERHTADVKLSLRGGGGEADTKLGAANRLYTRKQEARPAVAVLNDLTKLVPDGTWLNSIDFAGSKLTIIGRGTEIPKVIGSLEASGAFADVNFASATQRDPNLNADIFSISAAIETAEPAP